MGYRSDVAIALPKEIFALSPDYIKEDEDADIVDRGEHVVILYNDVKWYDDYAEVSQIMGYLRSLPDDKYGFIRVGEEPGDIEEEGSPDEFNMHTTTHTEIHYY